MTAISRPRRIITALPGSAASGARDGQTAVARRKAAEIIVVKSGRTARSALAAASHTGAIAGDDTLYSAVFRRAGVVRVDEIEDLFDASEALSRVGARAARTSASSPMPAGRA